MKTVNKQLGIIFSLSTLLALGIVFVPSTFAQQSLICPTPAQRDSAQLIPCYIRELPAPTVSVALAPSPTPLPEVSLELPLNTPNETIVLKNTTPGEQAPAQGENPDDTSTSGNDQSMQADDQSMNSMDDTSGMDDSAQSQNEQQDCGGY